MFDLAAFPETAARSLVLTTVALAWVVVAVRILGLRTFSKMTAFDFVATVATGSLLAAAATASSWTSFFQTGLAIAVLLALQAGLAQARVKSDRLRDIMGNTPVILMENGEFCENALQQTRVAREDVLAKIRESNTLQLGDVRVVVLENTGDISVLHGGEVDQRILTGVRRV